MSVFGVSEDMSDDDFRKYMLRLAGDVASVSRSTTVASCRLAEFWDVRAAHFALARLNGSQARVPTIVEVSLLVRCCLLMLDPACGQSRCHNCEAPRWILRCQSLLKLLQYGCVLVLRLQRLTKPLLQIKADSDSRFKAADR